MATNSKYLVEIVIKSSKTGTGGKEAQKEMTGLQKATQSFGKGFKIIGGIAKGVAGGLGVVATAAIALKKALDLGREGAVINQTAESFDLLIRKVGASSNLLDQLRSKSLNTISDMDLMSSTTTLLAGAQGELATELANATPQLIEIAKAANKLNPSLGSTTFLYESLSTGIKRASPMILDNLGLTIKLGAANEAYAKTLGKTVEELTAEEQKLALLNATVEAGGVLLDQAGGSAEAATDKFDQLTVMIGNLTDQMKAGLAPALEKVAGLFVNIFDFMDVSDLTALSRELGRTEDSYREYTRTMFDAIVADKQLSQAEADAVRRVIARGESLEFVERQTGMTLGATVDYIRALGVMTEAEFYGLKGGQELEGQLADSFMRTKDAARATLEYATAEDEATESTEELEEAQKALEEALERSRQKYADYAGTLAEGIVGLRDLGSESQKSMADYETALAGLDKKAKQVYGDVKKEFKSSLPDKTTTEERMKMAGDAWDEWALRLDDIIKNGVQSPWFNALNEMGMQKPPDTGVKEWAADLKSEFYQGELPNLINKQAEAWQENTQKMKAAQEEATAAYNAEVGNRMAAIEEERQALIAAREEQLAAEKAARQEATLQLALSLAEQTGLLQAWSMQKFGPDFSQVADSASEVQALLASGMLGIDSSLQGLIANVTSGIGNALDLTGNMAEENKTILDNILSGDFAARQQENLQKAFDLEGALPPGELEAARVGIASIPESIPAEPFAALTAGWDGFAMGLTEDTANMGIQFGTTLTDIDTKGEQTALDLGTSFNGAMTTMQAGAVDTRQSVLGEFQIMAGGLDNLESGARSWARALDKVQDEVKDIRKEFEKIPRSIEVTITTNTSGGGGDFQYGGQFIVKGPPGIDNVPVMFNATAGETVTVTPKGRTPPPNPQIETHNHWNLTVNAGGSGASALKSFRTMQALAGGL